MTVLNQSQLKKILPHAYPFVLIDRVEEIKVGESLIAIKNITANEWPFTALEDGSPQSQGILKYMDVYPETLLIEAAAQAALVLYHVTKCNNDNVLLKYILGRIKVRFINTVIIGTQIKIIAYATKIIEAGGLSNIEIVSGKKKYAELTLVFSVTK